MQAMVEKWKVFLQYDLVDYVTEILVFNAFLNSVVDEIEKLDTRFNDEAMFKVERINDALAKELDDIMKDKDSLMIADAEVRDRMQSGKHV